MQEANSLCVGDLVLSPNLMLAPMEGITDVAFRQLIRTLGGCSLVFTEFVASQNLNRGEPKAVMAASFEPDEHPIGVQIYGKDPVELANAAKWAQDLGADIVDLNLGCPSKRVVSRSGGAGLMREPQLVAELVRQMRAAITIPLSVKMRSGWSESMKNAVEIARISENEGAEMVTVHWRTRADGYGGVRDLSIIRDVVDALSIPVVANGDIIDVESAQKSFQETGCAGLMIGRGAVRDPWIFRKIEASLSGVTHQDVSVDIREAMLFSYLEAILPRFKTKQAALGRFKKIARYFSDGVPEGDKLRRSIFHSETIEQVKIQVKTHFNLLRDSSV